MQCPKCLEKNTKVIDSRPIEEGKVIRRRRECVTCMWRFTTFERFELAKLIVIKNDGTSSLYSREKVERGIWLSCGKLPVTRSDIDKIIQELEEKWFTRKEILSKEIGDDVMDKLKRLNKIAYIRFASVYREFKDLEDFQKEIQNIFSKNI